MLFSFLMLFIVVVSTVATFQYLNEKRLRTESLQESLINYADIVAKQAAKDPNVLPSFVKLFPRGLRITVIDVSGNVLFENEVDDVTTMNNHIDRPEIQEAINTGRGFNIRFSNTLSEDYYYVAIKRNNLIVRTALAYTIDLKTTYLRPDSFFMYFIIILVIILIFILLTISSRFSKSIEALRDFSLQKQPNTVTPFPQGELGDIGRRIQDLHSRNEDQKERLQMEKDKLIKHFHYSESGIAIFSSNRELVYNNSLFVQYSGFISPDTYKMGQILETKEFQEIIDFLDKESKSSYLETKQVGERYFTIKVIMFDDDSFEVMLSDITVAEKNRRIKRDMTQNIAHELKTPVSTIKGYLETLQNISVSQEKQKHFLERASLQADRLTELVTDIAVITKMEESPNLYPKEKVSLNQIIEQSTDSSKLRVHLDIKDNLFIIGSRNLLHTIFQNLVDNANRYAGDNAEIFINCYLQDEQYYYFSVYDTGKGVDEKYLTRIFERFYRVDEGRNRNIGGTGLGLSLVKNAILMHNGDVQAKNRTEGGLNFLFTLKKE